MLDIWNRDGGSNCDQGYKCVPFYLSNLGYGVLVNTPDYVRFDVGMESVRHVQFSVEDEKLSYIVVGGEDAKDVLSRYTALIGRSPVPPVWTFGLWLSTSWIPDSTERRRWPPSTRCMNTGFRSVSTTLMPAGWMISTTATSSGVTASAMRAI